MIESDKKIIIIMKVLNRNCLAFYQLQISTFLKVYRAMPMMKPQI